MYRSIFLLLCVVAFALIWTGQPAESLVAPSDFAEITFYNGSFSAEISELNRAIRRTIACLVIVIVVAALVIAGVVANLLPSGETAPVFPKR